MRPILIASAATLALSGQAFAQEAQSPAVAAGRLPDAFAEQTPSAILEAERSRIARAEEALRRQITALQAGAPAYDEMTQGLADAVRPRAEQVTGVIDSLGELESVQHAGVENGAELFLVTFSAAPTQWIIGLDDEGKVGALLFRPAPPPAQ